MEFTAKIPDFERFKTEYNKVVEQGLADYKTDRELFILCMQAQIETEKRFKAEWESPYRYRKKKEIKGDTE